MLLAAALPLILTACSDGLDYQQKLSELTKAGERGADAHYVLQTEHSKITKKVCEDHYRTFTDGAPNDRSGFMAGRSENWAKLHEEYFVESCLSGEARVPKTRPTTTPPSNDNGTDEKEEEDDS